MDFDFFVFLAGDLIDEGDFIEAVNGDGADIAINRFRDFFFAFIAAVHADVFRVKSALQGRIQFSAGNDVEVDTVLLTDFAHGFI